MKDKIYMAHLYINGEEQEHFLVGGANKIKVRKYITDIYLKLGIIKNRGELKIFLFEMVYDGKNYLPKEENLYNEND